MKLTKKETIAFKAIVDNALKGMGGNEPKELHEDNFSWFDRKDLSELTGFSKHEAAGLMSSLGEKELVYDADDGEWAMTESGIDIAQELFV